MNNEETLESEGYKVLKVIPTEGGIGDNQKMVLVNESGKNILRFIEHGSDSNVHKIIADVNLNKNVRPELITATSAGDSKRIVVLSNTNAPGKPLELEAIVINLL